MAIDSVPLPTVEHLRVTDQNFRDVSRSGNRARTSIAIESEQYSAREFSGVRALRFELDPDHFSSVSA